MEMNGKCAPGSFAKWMYTVNCVPPHPGWLVPECEGRINSLPACYVPDAFICILLVNLHGHFLHLYPGVFTDRGSDVFTDLPKVT